MKLTVLSHPCFALTGRIKLIAQFYWRSIQNNLKPSETLFKPRSIHTCQQKPYQSGDRVPLSKFLKYIYSNPWRIKLVMLLQGCGIRSFPIGGLLAAPTQNTGTPTNPAVNILDSVFVSKIVRWVKKVLLHNSGSCNACTIKRSITLLCIPKQSTCRMVLLLNCCLY